MGGVTILVHAVRQVAGNLREALRISLVLYLVSQAAIMGATYAALGEVSGTWSIADLAPDDPYVEAEAAPGLEGVPVSAWLLFAASWVVWGVLSAWIAVRWHRFVLLEEHPAGAVPPWGGALVWAYVVRSMKIALVLGAVGIGVGLSLLATVMLLPPVLAAPLGLVGGLLATALLIVLPLRIGLGLPAAALGGAMSTDESWRATAPAWGSVLVLAVLSALLGYALDLPAALPGLPAAPEIAITLVVGWVRLMVSAAVLTTLYGHLVEGRALG